MMHQQSHDYQRKHLHPFFSFCKFFEVSNFWINFLSNLYSKLIISSQGIMFYLIGWSKGHRKDISQMCSSSLSFVVQLFSVLRVVVLKIMHFLLYLDRSIMNSCPKLCSQ